jgi:hypothetical protein
MTGLAYARPGFCTGGSGGITTCRAAVSGSSAKHSPQPVGHDAPNVGTQTCLIGHEFEHAKHLEGMDASRQLRVARVDTCPLQEC